eukprot:jgi/Phyca11/102798/e_gw1.7.541.1
MVGLSASQLPPETLRPGDILVYYSQGVVCGDRHGHRVGIVLKISGPYPVAQDTQETLPLTNMVRRCFDVAGTALFIDSVRCICVEYGSFASHNKLRSTGFVSESGVSESDGDQEAANESTEVSDTDALAAGEFVKAVPTRWHRQKCRHQRKVKEGHWTEGVLGNDVICDCAA